MQRLFKVPEEKITVIHHGFFESERDESFDPPHENYILFVGERGGYKNFYRFLDAVAPVLKERKINLVCAGSKPFCKSEEETMLRLGIRNHVTWIAPNDGQLNQLYHKALLFVYPSLYEGFGLPILEAFSNQCPIAISNTRCFAEVGGNAAEYFDPYNAVSITQAINNVLSSSIRADELREAGKLQLQKFPLRLCIDKHLGVYRMLAAKHK